MMNLTEAYQEAMEAVEELKDSGIEVKIVPSRSRTMISTLEKYGKLAGRTSPDKWYHVTFFPDTADQREAISRKCRELGWCGIAFDTGGSVGYRDWELDWSFRVNDTPDGDREAACDIVNDVLESMEQAE